LVFVTLAALASPDPAVARYILAFPGLVLAFAAPALSTKPLRRDWLRGAILGLVALGCGLNLYTAYPGLQGEGPPITAYFHMSEDQRKNAVGADLPPTGYYRAISTLKPGEYSLFDLTADLPYLAWPTDLSRRAEYIPDGVTESEAERLVSQPGV